MVFYVDFDDCLCETAKSFTEIAARLFDKKVPYEDVRFFNLQKTFDLNEEEYQLLMEEGHRPEVLLSYEETPGCSQVINEWLDRGHEVYIITGRPYSAYEPSRQWLDEHGLERVKLFCLNKYGRDAFYQAGEHNLELEDFYQMQFDFAVEDSPFAFPYLEHFSDLKVMVFDRPWNQECDFPNDNFKRVKEWKSIKEYVENLLGQMDTSDISKSQFKGKMEYWKWINLIPTVLFIIRDMLGMAGINPIWLLVAVALAIMNVFKAKSMREYLLASLLLLLSCVVGMILNTYYYYYFISSDSETPIVGAFAVMVYGILVLVLTGVGAVILAIKNRQKKHECKG